jgi:hypothetical protein
MTKGMVGYKEHRVIRHSGGSLNLFEPRSGISYLRPIDDLVPVRL